MAYFSLVKSGEFKCLLKLLDFQGAGSPMGRENESHVTARSTG